MNKANSNVHVAASFVLGVTWGLTLSVRFLDFFNASRLQKLELLLVGGLVSSLLWYLWLGWIFNHRDSFLSRWLLLLAGLGGLLVTMTGWLAKTSFILASLPGSGTSIASGVLRVLGLLAYLLSISSLIWLLIGSLWVGIRAVQNTHVSLIELTRLTIPFLAISTITILANLFLYQPIEHQDNYRLRKLPTNTLEELIRRSPDTTSELRIYLAFQENYPGATLITTPSTLSKSGLDPNELKAKGGAQQVVLLADAPAWGGKELGHLRIAKEIRAGENNEQFLFVQAEQFPETEVWLLESEGRYYFVPHDALQNPVNTP